MDIFEHLVGEVSPVFFTCEFDSMYCGDFARSGLSIVLQSDVAYVGMAISTSS
jgi:hypothetical protein